MAQVHVAAQLFHLIQYESRGMSHNYQNFTLTPGVNLSAVSCYLTITISKACTQNSQWDGAPVLLGTGHADSEQAPSLLRELVTQTTIQQFLNILM